MKEIVIAIPVYKKKPDSDETMSLMQCLKVLSRYNFVLVCPHDLDTAEYDRIAGKELATERFDKGFFDGIRGYNSLMLSQQFYLRFKEYDYMLIYQLDAWVFSDQLEEWCKKGYDYVGAPWFGDWKTHEDGEELTDCGNGGLSLRRISKFIEITNPNATAMTRGEICRRYFKHFKTWGGGIERMLGFKNTIAWHMRKNRHLWEDAYFCRALKGLRYELKLPTAEEAALFSFERSSGYLFSITGKLPFGCHAWRKYEYDTFWKKYIPAQ